VSSTDPPSPIAETTAVTGCARGVACARGRYCQLPVAHAQAVDLGGARWRRACPHGGYQVISDSARDPPGAVVIKRSLPPE
jgi:hypothetical protein